MSNNKICTRCNLEKTIDNFSTHGRRSNGTYLYKNECKNCHNEKRRKNKKKEEPRKGQKKCTKCNVVKTFDEYFLREPKKNGDIRYASQCKNCRNQYYKQYRDKKPKKPKKLREPIKKKVCNCCNIEKSIDEYSKDGKIYTNGDFKYQSECKSCIKIKRTCKHGIRKKSCYRCSTNRQLFCSICQMILLTHHRRKLKITVCEACGTQEQKLLRLEIKWKNIFNSWGYRESVNDKIIKDNECKVVNLKRCDFLYLTEDEFPYSVIVECDENNHNHCLVSCEMKSLQDKADQITANQEKVKPVVVIRFNPNYKDEEYLERELKTAFHEVFNNPSSVNISDARGLNIYKLIGYSDKRREKYDNEPLAQTITKLDAFAN